jgi:hypothetical protein
VRSGACVSGSDNSDWAAAASFHVCGLSVPLALNLAVEFGVRTSGLGRIVGLHRRSSTPPQTS